jgi:two-component system OmpR family sensor kinase
VTQRWHRLPVRLRLVAGFVGAMLVLLASAGAFVVWRVEIALDRTLDTELNAVDAEVQGALREHPGRPATAFADLPARTLAQLVDRAGHVLASSPNASDRPLLTASQAAGAGSQRLEPGSFLTRDFMRHRSQVRPQPDGTLLVVAVALAQRDEALRELLAQLALAQVGALAIASAVGYRLTRGALTPVETYRRQAALIAAGATGTRLAVPDHPDDEITRLGHTLNDMLRSLEQTAASQRQFLADASHELRAPLTVLSSEVELALRRPRSAMEYEQTLQQVAVDTAQLVALANQLLDLERASLNGGTCDLAEVLGRGPSVRVPLDAVTARQVLTNLVTNAQVHGAGPITVGLREEHGIAVLQVHDSGSGPPPEFVPHAVERFRRADEARSTPGSGLGLALVHQVVALHGGELRLCCRGGHHRFAPEQVPARCTHPEEGTTATVLLPTTP